MFQKAEKRRAKLRLAIYGPSGSGKTYTGIAIACGIVAGTGSRVAVIDTERGSASKYADLYDFDVLDLEPPYHPEEFVRAIRAAEDAGYGAIVIDSLSHAWSGPGGILEIVDEEARKTKGNSYVAWGKGTPLQNRLVDAMTRARLHVVATMRAKTEYVIEQTDRGKSAPRKVGMAPVQRDGMEYEFDLALDMTVDNDAIVAKTRCPALAGRVLNKPGADLVRTLREWLQGSSATAEAAPEGKTGARAEEAQEPSWQSADPAGLDLDEARKKGASAVWSLAKTVFGDLGQYLAWLEERRVDGAPWMSGADWTSATTEDLRAVYAAILAERRARA